MKKLSKTLVTGAAASLVVAAGLAFAQTSAPNPPLPSGNTGGSDMSASTTNGNSSTATEPEGGAVNHRMHKHLKNYNGTTTDNSATVNSTTSSTLPSADTSSSTDSSVSTTDSSQLAPRADRN